MPSFKKRPTRQYVKLFGFTFHGDSKFLAVLGMLSATIGRLVLISSSGGGLWWLISKLLGP